jgi:hypothetical protein
MAEIHGHVPYAGKSENDKDPDCCLHGILFHVLIPPAGHCIRLISLS